MGEFPNVRLEPTSEVDQLARSDHFTVYELSPCPECGGEAFKKSAGGGVAEYACRSCRFGSRLLQNRSNYGSDWEEVRQWVLERENRECWACGESGGLAIHHIEKLVWFETTDEAHRPDNLVALCEDCHSELENKPEAFDEIVAENP
mgnify:CR=1 FL=1